MIINCTFYINSNSIYCYVHKIINTSYCVNSIQIITILVKFSTKHTDKDDYYCIKLRTLYMNRNT